MSEICRFSTDAASDFKTGALNRSATHPFRQPHIVRRGGLCKAHDEPSWPAVGFPLASDVGEEA
jgi:hypothetical protein